MRTIKRASLSKEEIVRRLRLADHYRYIRGRYGQQLPDDDAGREDLYELLLVISLAAGCYRKMKMAIQIWAGWMSKEEAEELVDRICFIIGDDLAVLSQGQRGAVVATTAPTWPCGSGAKWQAEQVIVIG